MSLTTPSSKPGHRLGKKALQFDGNGRNKMAKIANAILLMAKMAKTKKKTKTKKKILLPLPPLQRMGLPKTIGGLTRFWDVYPKKSAKKDAFDAWKRVDPDEVLVKRILEAVKQQKLWPQYSGENARYFPSPSKWLDGGCWDDEPLAGEEDPYAKFT